MASANFAFPAGLKIDVTSPISPTFTLTFLPAIELLFTCFALQDFASFGTSIRPFKNFIFGKYLVSIHASKTNPTNPIAIPSTPFVNNCQSKSVCGHGISSGAFFISIPNKPADINIIPRKPAAPNPGKTKISIISKSTPAANTATSSQFAIPTRYLLPTIIAKHITAVNPGRPTPGVLNSI